MIAIMWHHVSLDSCNNNTRLIRSANLYRFNPPSYLSSYLTTKQNHTYGGLPAKLLFQVEKLKKHFGSLNIPVHLLYAFVSPFPFLIWLC